jgi:beta-phosphoglucomutase family hydrolase
MTIKVHPEAKALIFDLDGTLSDSLPVHLETWNQIGRRFGFKFDPQILLEMTGRPTIEFAQRVVEQYRLSEEPENLVRLKQESFWESMHLLKPIKEVVSIVKSYQGKIPMTVGTGASRTSAELQLKELGIADCFLAIVSANEVTRHKPHPETFLECARIMGVEPKYCQVFEDGNLGIEAAQKAGMIVTDLRRYFNYGVWAGTVNQ